MAKDIRLVVNARLEDSGSFTLHNIKVLAVNEIAQTRLDGYMTIEGSYANANLLFDAIKSKTVDIVTSTLV